MGVRQLGCSIDYLGQPGYPPLRIGTPQLQLDAPIRVRGDVSSQFLTALLMALPLAAHQDITIEVVGELISKPYIEITLNLLERFGIRVARQDWSRFTIPAGSRYRSPGEIASTPRHSASMMAISGSPRATASSVSFWRLCNRSLGEIRAIARSFSWSADPMAGL